MMKMLQTVTAVGILVGAGIATVTLLTHESAAGVGRPGVGAGGVGRPGAPVAGVARRTTRRMVRRTSVYVATLPQGATPVVVEGTTLYQSGGTYYQASGNQYEVVTVE